MVAMVAMIAAVIFTGCIEKEVLGTIQVKVTSSTWREGNVPFDIYSAIKEKLEKVGFEVVSNGNSAYNATLLVDYKEEKSSIYSVSGFPFAEHGFATNITCNLKLYDKDSHQLFVKEISTSFLPKDSKVPIDVSISGFLYDNTLFRFERNDWFVCLGEIIAGKYSIGDEVPALITALEDEDWYLARSSAARVLGEIGDKRAVEPLIDALKNDKASSVQGSAAEAVGKIGDKRVVELLIKALKDEDWQVRLGAAKGLGELGDKRAVEPLIDALEDERMWVRERAAEALGKIGDERAVEPLTAVLEDKERAVRTAARRALEKIEKGKRF